jgi:YHS domain-containing protein
VIAFIFADLIIIPIVIAYRKYYGARFAALLTGLMFGTMVLAALAIDGIFSLAGLVPDHRPSVASISERAVTWNYTAFLDIAFGVLFVALIAVTVRRGTTDPVCGMTVGREGPTSSYAGRTFTFCGNHCKHTFDASPEAYT